MKINTDIKIDTVLKNGRIYPKDVLKNAINDFLKQDIKIGEFGINDDIKINTENISHEVKDVFIDDNDVVSADIQILDTIQGTNLKKIPEDKLKCHLRGYGKIEDNNKVSDFKIISLDVFVNE